MSAEAAQLELRAVSRDYGGTPPVAPLCGVDLRVDPGEYVAIVGRSGAGKSTVMNILGLLDRPTGGTYTVLGHESERLSDAARSDLRAETFGFVFQSFHLVGARTALWNAALALRGRGRGRRWVDARAMECLTMVGLADRAHLRCDVLSGGERQRVAIARALGPEPAILLCDEPTGNLDDDVSAHIVEILEARRAGGTTLIVVTHDRRLAARAGRVLALQDGRLV